MQTKSEISFQYYLINKIRRLYKYTHKCMCVLALDSRSIEYSVKTKRKCKFFFLRRKCDARIDLFFRFLSLRLLATAFGCFLRQPLGNDYVFSSHNNILLSTSIKKRREFLTKWGCSSKKKKKKKMPERKK